MVKFFKFDPETKGMIIGAIVGITSSITSSLITLYIAQNYLVKKAASTAIEEYKKKTTPQTTTSPTIIRTHQLQEHKQKFNFLSKEEFEMIDNIIES